MVDLARSHTTVAVERAVLRLAGITGADPDGIPWVNRLVDAVASDVGLGHGVALPVWHALAREGLAMESTVGAAATQAEPTNVAQSGLTQLAQKAAAGSVRFDLPTGRDATAARRAARRAVGAGIKRIDRRRASGSA